MSNRACALFIAAALWTGAASADELTSGNDWTVPAPVMYRGEIAMTYRARLAGDWLIVEAKHSPEWHSYAMDNIERARKASGKETPETELPTRIKVTGGLKAAGPWKQSPPQDFSKKDIHWFSWGFRDTAVFAVRVERTEEAEALVTVNAQSCNANSCSMVRDLKIRVPLGIRGSKSDDPAELISALVDLETSAPS